jgi:hypothetical protein
MWICLNDAFFSIVASDRDPALLNVRARRAGDIEAYFPGNDVVRLAGTDYAFRAFISRQIVADKISDQVASIAYSNFKSSVRDDALHNAYLDIWSVMSKLQRRLLRTRWWR